MFVSKWRNSRGGHPTSDQTLLGDTGFRGSYLTLGCIQLLKLLSALLPLLVRVFFLATASKSQQAVLGDPYLIDIAGMFHQTPWTACAPTDLPHLSPDHAALNGCVRTRIWPSQFLGKSPIGRIDLALFGKV